MAEDTDQPPASALLPGRTRRVRKRGGRLVGLGFPADRQHPPGRDGDGQPQLFGSLGIGHAGVLALPAAPLDF